MRMWTGMMVLLVGCGGTDPLLVEWTEVDTSGSEGMVGASFAGGHVVGGLLDDLSVTTTVLAVDGSDPLAVSDAADLATPRFCGCALFDEVNGEIVSFGGRNTAGPQASAERIDPATGTSTPVDGAELVGTIGCSAIFDPGTGMGYVFGGGRGAFSADTWRYDPADHSLTQIDVEGPSARYDAGTVRLPDGDMLIVGGMGMGAGMSPDFRDDVWRFDVGSETWSEVSTSGDFEGRRFPFITLGPDDAFVYVGYGSDHPGGQSVLDDLWALELETGVFTELSPEGDEPRERGFALSLPGPEDTLGIMAWGGDAQTSVVEDAWVLALQ
jgi:hypothetical protein